MSQKQTRHERLSGPMDAAGRFSMIGRSTVKNLRTLSNAPTCRDFRANFTVTLCCEVNFNSGRKWEFQYQREIANGTYFHSCTGRARVSARARRPRGRSPGWRARAGGRRGEQWRARLEQLCVGVEQRWQGLRSVTPSPHATRAQRLTQLRVGPRVPQR